LVSIARVGSVEAQEELELDQDSAFRGSLVDYEITQAEDYETFVATIRADRALDEDIPDPRVFRADQQYQLNSLSVAGHRQGRIEVRTVSQEEGHTAGHPSFLSDKQLNALGSKGGPEYPLR